MLNNFKNKKHLISIFLLKTIIFLLIFLFILSSLTSCKIIDNSNLFHKNFILKLINLKNSFTIQKNSNTKITQQATSSTTSSSNISDATNLESKKINIFISESVPSFISSLLKQKIEFIFKNYNIIDSNLKNLPSSEQDLKNYDIIIDLTNAKYNLKNYLIYCFVTDFYSLDDNITLQNFKDYWYGNSNYIDDNILKNSGISLQENLSQKDEKYSDNTSSQTQKIAENAQSNSKLMETKLLMSEETYKIISKFFGECKNNNLEILKSYEIKNSLKNIKNSIAIIPFNDLTKELKVLNINGNSIFDKHFSYLTYPFSFSIEINGNDLNNSSKLKEIFENSFYSNMDPNKLTVVNMSGVTALVRGVANKMDKKGILYPGIKIADTLKNADIVHISNEVSFKENANASQKGTTFCSKPEYIELLKYVGANLIELTGNHLNDFGSKYLEYTLKIYDSLGWKYFGGGANIDEAKKPALFNINGNKIAFLGFNQFGPDYDWATKTMAGSAPPDDNYYIDEIKQLKKEGYAVIFTFQYEESYNYYPLEEQIKDFRKMRDAGADIVSGSQAHQPMGFELTDKGLICYGLGNLFFDQMQSIGTRQGFIAKHIFYDGKYISTQIIPTIIDDYCQPRLMTESEKIQFLKTLFDVSIK